ncbi:MAG: tetratricopeptide repeat protein, partial [Planctomycetota bacterium]
MHDPDGGEPAAESPFERAIRAGFRDAAEPGESVLARLSRQHGVRSAVLLHDAPGEDSPLLKVHSLDRSETAADDSRYQIAGEIARGGIGVVYKGRDRDLGRDVALKVLRRDHAQNPEIFERFIEEAQIGGQLQHPGIVPVYGIGLQPDGRPYFTMKLIKGRTLAALLKERQDPGERRRRFLQIFEQACQTMAYAHSRGVIHRDLKPSNVMVGNFGEVLVADWGFGKVLGRPEPVRTEEERTVIATVRSAAEGSESVAGSVMGTPAYMSPEQALGHVEELDEQCDVFSLGAILCQVLTGAPPYVGPSKDLLVQAAQARLDDAFGRLDACAADPELIDLAKRCLSPLRSNRPEDAGELAQAITGHLAAAEERAHRAEVQAVEEHARLARARKHAAWERRAKRKTRILAVAALLALILGGGIWFWNEVAEREHAAEARPQVEAAMEEATHLSAQGRWTEALAVARKARDLAAAGGLETGPAETLLAETQRGRQAAEAAAEKKKADAELVAELEEIRLRRAEDYDAERTDAAYVEAFRKRGIDPARPEDAAARIRTAYPAILVDLAATLDGWAWLRRAKEELAERDWRVLRQVAQLADPDPWRSKLREAAADSDLERLRGLAAEAFEQDLPVRTLDLLGVLLKGAGDVEAAIAHLRRVHRTHPGDFWVNYHLGLYSRQLEDPRMDEAIRFYTAALALKPNARAFHGLAHALGGNGLLDEAIASYREAIRLDPEDGRVRACLGGALLGKGLPDEAVASYRDAIRLDPAHAPSHVNLGCALSDKGLHDEAIASVREGIRLDPKNADAHNNLGHFLYVKGLLEDAIASYREAIRLDPQHAVAHVNLAAAHWDKGLYDEAITSYREAIRLDPKQPLTHVNLAGVLRKKGLLDEAIASLREAIRLDPESALARHRLGQNL